MIDVANGGLDASGRALTEGFARIVAADSATVWLEPEMSSGCGTCASAKGCSSLTWMKLGPADAKRFALPNDFNGRVGERVVVGIQQGSLVRASALAYGLPLLIGLGSGIYAQARGAGDEICLLATVAGLAVGFVLAKFVAGRLTAKGDFRPIYLRRSFGADACDLTGHA